jgi:endonuclease/exonuclease/phosphatase family metal-dependent hydrolase
MTVSILQWNIWYQEDITRVAEFIKQHSPDIICLQELTIGFPGRDIKDTPAHLADQLGYNYHHKELPIESTTGEPLMLANGIFSRFAITDQRSVWINEPKSGGGYNDEYRAYVEVTLEINGKQLHIGTTHMSYTHRFELTDSKRAETDRLVEELRKHDTNFVFAGDLNAPPDSYTINKLSEILRGAGPDYGQKTWTTKPFAYNGFEETGLNWRLDYIFTSKDLQAKSADILTTDYSDHLPILVTLTP